MKKPKMDMDVTELFMAQADKFRRFYGTIKRERDNNGNSVVRGKIKVNEGHVFAVAGNQDELGKNLDDMVKFILDANLHDNWSVTAKIGETDFNLN